MSKRFEISEVLSAINNFLENRELHQKDPDLALRFADQLKKMEVWFLCKVYLDKSVFLHKVVDFCQSGEQNDVRKFMAFVRYSFRQLGPDRFEDCINRSGLTSGEKGLITRCFRVAEIDHELARGIAGAAGTGHRETDTSGILSGVHVN